MTLKTGTYTLLKSDKEAGIKQLFEVYSKKLLDYATYKWHLTDDQAWDLIYTCIYKTADLIHRYQFETEQKFASFLFKLFMNAIRDHLKSSKYKTDSIPLLKLEDTNIHDHAQLVPDEQPSQAMVILQQELDRLEDWQRMLVLMRNQELPYSEIAKYVHKPEEQLKTYYARIKKLLVENVNKQLILKMNETNV